MSYHNPKLKLQRSVDRVVPASVTGRYRRIKWGLLALSLTVTYGLPFLRWDRGPGRPDQAILFDLSAARFHLFGLDVRPQELYYLTGLLIVATATLVLMNALAGRVWCGFFCPQTIWTDLFLLVERRIEGDRRERLLKLGRPLTLRRAGEIVLKHALWLVIAAGTGGVFVLYFADAPTLVADVFTGRASDVAYGMIATLTLTTYGLAGFAREKMCTFMCPWPRLQGAIWDRDALSVTYRDHRGEPRLSAKKADAARRVGQPAGDCVDCAACVVVCPMGIDIREGPSIACINCGLCVDACDGTMEKLGRDRGLIDYETWGNVERGRLGLPREPARLVRLRTVAPAAAIVLLVAAMAASVSTRAEMAVGVVHDRDPIAVRLSDGRSRNGYELRLVNAAGSVTDVRVTVRGAGPTTLAAAGLGPDGPDGLRLTLQADETRRIRLTLSGGADLAGPVTFTATALASGESVATEDFFRLAE